MGGLSGGFQITGYTTESVKAHCELENWPYWKGPVSKVRGKQQVTHFTVDELYGGNPGDWLIITEDGLVHVCPNTMFGVLYAQN